MSESVRIPNFFIDHTLHKQGSDLIMKKKEKENITERELSQVSLANSKILNCEIKDREETISNAKKFRPTAIAIWKKMPTQRILQTTTFNFKLEKVNGEKGYLWNKDIMMSFQNKDATGTLKEILKMVKLNNFTIDLTIRLRTGKIIHFKN